jgi:hypothetical protein
MGHCRCFWAPAPKQVAPRAIAIATVTVTDDGTFTLAPTLPWALGFWLWALGGGGGHNRPLQFPAVPIPSGVLVAGGPGPCYQIQRFRFLSHATAVNTLDDAVDR